MPQSNIETPGQIACPYAGSTKALPSGEQYLSCGLINSIVGVADGWHHMARTACAECEHVATDPVVVDRVKKVRVMRVTRYWDSDGSDKMVKTTEQTLADIKADEGADRVADLLVDAVRKGMPQAEAERLAEAVVPERLDAKS